LLDKVLAYKAGLEAKVHRDAKDLRK
jgi:hypothetical protein